MSALPSAVRPTGGIPLRLLVLAVVCAGALVVALSVGGAGVPLREVMAALTGAGDATTRTIVIELRLPRAVLAVVAGGALAVAGTVFQALLRNPLAEPYVLGVSNGAAVGAVALVTLGAGVRAPGVVPLGALAGALGAIALVFAIAVRVGRALDTRVLLLAGVIVGAFLNAVILLLLTFADVESFRSAIFWMMGSLAAADWPSTALVSAYLLPACIVLLALARAFNLLAMGEETAIHLGVHVERVKVTAYLVASLLVAVTVSVAGVIGFIGLIVPHALRLLWGSDHRMLVPGCFLAGGAFLLLADTLARTVVPHSEIPVGVITALIGVPIFVVLLTRSSP